MGNTVQETLGQLFIDFGTKGFNPLQQQLKLIKGNFNFATTAAKAFTNFLITSSKAGGEYVTQLEKIKSVPGLKMGFIQDLERFSKLNNIDFNNFIGQIENLQQKLVKLKMTGHTEGIEGFTMLGLNPRDFDYNNPMAMLEAIRVRVQKVDEATAAGALNLLGLDKQLLYVWKQQNKGFAERLRLNDKEMQNLKEQQTAWNNLADAWETGQKNFISNQTWINDLLNEGAKLVTDFFGQYYRGNEQAGNEQSSFFQGLAALGWKLGKWKQDRKDIVLSEKGLAQDSIITKQLMAAYQSGQKDIFKRWQKALEHNRDLLDKDQIQWLEKISKNLEDVKDDIEGKNTGSTGSFPFITDLINAQIINGKNLPTIKDIPENIPGASVITNNSTSGGTFAVTINQTITGEEAGLIANESSSQIRAELNSIFNQNLANT